MRMALVMLAATLALGTSTACKKKGPPPNTATGSGEGSSSAAGSNNSTGDTKKPETTIPDDPTCPLLVQGTSISVEDTDQGAAFVFATTGDAAAVRTRAQKLAELHNGRRAREDGKLESVCQGCMADVVLVPSKAAVLEAPTGARVVFTPIDPTKLNELVTQMRMHGKHLAGGNSCHMVM